MSFNHPGKFVLFLLSLALMFESQSQGFLKVDGTRIVNAQGENVLLRGMGLGGWMLQEGYMLRVPGQGQQHKIRGRIAELLGEEKTQAFYDAWLANHTRKIDIDSMKAWGFNSVRLPMHYNLYTLPIEDEPVKGENTWIEKGFGMTDSLLAWCAANQMYLILDLHAAPGGQGNDLNISDGDTTKPFLWESEANQQKTIALWRKLAERYVNQPWIGGYDLINEPNWGFEDPADKNGLKEKKNAPLRKLMVDITAAIRAVDKNHIIIIEGNGWGNNYNGILPPWDDNMVLSFHKYWNHNDQASIQHIVDTRQKHNVPVWLGETGENSNVWFTDAIALLERNNIGWAWWPLKKLGHNNPMQVTLNPGYANILAYWQGKGEKPSAEEAYKAVMQFANDTKLENTTIKRDVIDAMFRQPHSRTAIPYKQNLLKDKLVIKAVDYDMGRNGVAYFDKDTANYHVSTGKRTPGNRGNMYRNDGVDIAEDSTSKGSYYVNHIEDGEWLQYSINAAKSGSYDVKVIYSANAKQGKFTVLVNGQPFATSIPATSNGRQTVQFKNIPLKKGPNVIRIVADKGGFDLVSLELEKD